MIRSAESGGGGEGVKSRGWTGSWEVGRGHQMTIRAMMDRGKGKGVVGLVGAVIIISLILLYQVVCYVRRLC